MKTTVTTPTLTPRIVNAERNLLVRTVSNAIKADSLTSMRFINRFPFSSPTGRGCEEAQRNKEAIYVYLTLRTSLTLASPTGKGNFTQLSVLQSDPVSLRAMPATSH